MASSAALVMSSFIFISLLFTFSEAKHFLVGGKPNGWQIPSSPSDSLNSWASANRFQIGDSLVWKFDGEKDSVLQVTRKGYQSCNASAPIAAYKGGDVTVNLERSGTFYFISGEEGHCEKGVKLIVAVLSDRNRGGGISPAPSPIESARAPAVPPSSGSTSPLILKSGFSVGILMVVVGMLLL